MKAFFTAATVGNVDVTLTGSNGAVPVLNAAASTSDDGQPAGDNLHEVSSIFQTHARAEQRIRRRNLGQHPDGEDGGDRE